VEAGSSASWFIAADLPLLPQQLDRRVHEQLQQERRREAAHHRGRTPDLEAPARPDCDAQRTAASRKPAWHLVIHSGNTLKIVSQYDDFQV
jgi:hypothetical protein